MANIGGGANCRRWEFVERNIEKIGRAAALISSRHDSMTS